MAWMNANRITSEALCVGEYASADSAEEMEVPRLLPVGLHCQLVEEYDSADRRIVRSNLVRSSEITSHAFGVCRPENEIFAPNSLPAGPLPTGSRGASRQANSKLKPEV